MSFKNKSCVDYSRKQYFDKVKNYSKKLSFLTAFDTSYFDV